MIKEIVATQDGSSTVLNKLFNETYHSSFGALQESRHVFIDAGLKYKITSNTKLSILEMGFGTGLNALLTYIEAVEQALEINYITFEKYPLVKAEYNQLNYCTLLGDKYNTVFEILHNCDWNIKQKIDQNFSFLKLDLDFETINYSNHFDIVYFDAFSPTVQPELWTDKLFSKIYMALKKNGILVTYCAKGEVKRTLKSVGFTIESLKGPLGKREMIRGLKI